MPHEPAEKAPPSTDVRAGRQILSELVGRLMAKSWLRTRHQPDSDRNEASRQRDSGQERTGPTP